MVGVATVLEGLRLVPGLVVMDIHDNVFHIVICEEVVPVCVVCVDGDDLSVVEHKFGLRSVLLDQFSCLSIPVLESWENWVNLRLIEWLESVESWVLSVSLQ